MVTCPSDKLSLPDAISTVQGELIEKITDTTIVNQLKQYLLTLNTEFSIFSQASDTFLLFKIPVGGLLVEFINGCSTKYMVMDSVAFIELIKNIGIGL